MRIVVTSVFVEDQEQALGFYTEILGFRKRRTYRWANFVG